MARGRFGLNVELALALEGLAALTDDCGTFPRGRLHAAPRRLRTRACGFESIVDCMTELGRARAATLAVFFVNGLGIGGGPRRFRR